MDINLLCLILTIKIGKGKIFPVPDVVVKQYKKIKKYGKKMKIQNYFKKKERRESRGRPI